MLSSIFTAVTLLSGAALAKTGKLGNAAITTNTAGVSYQAVFPESNTSSIRGQITGTSNSNGTGVDFNVNFYGLPHSTDGPFEYHIHVDPVPSDGNCTGTLDHLDPYIRGQSPACDAKQPQTCQVGDLSGKHGNATNNPYQKTYLDLYTTTTDGLGSFFGNRSVVIHSKNGTRLTCANFSLVSDQYASSSSAASRYTDSMDLVSRSIFIGLVLGLVVMMI